MRVTTIIMDMDGTITHFNLDFISARRKALEELEKMNLRTPDMTEQLSIYLTLKGLKDKLDPNVFEEIRAKLYAILEDMELKAAKDVALYPGAIATLRKLRELSLRIGIVTNNGRAGTELTLKKYDLAPFFDVIVTRDDCEEMKPDAGSLRMAMEELHAKPAETVYVGDSVIDIQAARAADLPIVAVGTGPFSSERLAKAEPDYLLGSINDLPTLIELLDK
jgi:HAD superfamily hydrolase (TIGR01662 family)